MALNLLFKREIVISILIIANSTAYVKWPIKIKPAGAGAYN